MKKLLVLTNTMNQGGAETFIMKIYRIIDKNQYQFDFYIMGEEGFYDEEIISLGGKITYAPMKTKGFKKYKNYLTNFLAENKYKYVYKSVANSISELDFFYVKKFEHAKVIAARSMIAKNGNSILHYLFRPLANTFSTVKLAPSTEAANFMFGKRQIRQNKVILLNNGVPIEQFAFDNEVRMRVREMLKLKDDSKLFIHIGRFSRQKNHCFLLEVFEKVNKLDNNTYLLCVGSGELKQSFIHNVASKNLEKNVILFDKRTDVNELLMAADMMLLPSLFEGLPNVVIEAQATGLPCIVSEKVTREAKVTNLVTFLNINDSNLWGEHIVKHNLKLSNQNRLTFNTFPNDYHINEVVKKFINTIFKGEKNGK